MCHRGPCNRAVARALRIGASCLDSGICPPGCGNARPDLDYVSRLGRTPCRRRSSRDEHPGLPSCRSAGSATHDRDAPSAFSQDCEPAHRCTVGGPSSDWLCWRGRPNTGVSGPPSEGDCDRSQGRQLAASGEPSSQEPHIRTSLVHCASDGSSDARASRSGAVSDRGRGDRN